MSAVDERLAWLTATLDMIEQVARAAFLCCYSYGREEPTGEWRMGQREVGAGRIVDANGEVVVYDEGAPTEEQAAHIVLHDPRSALARVEVDRRVLARHGRYIATHGPFDGQPICGCSNFEDQYYAEAWPCDDLRDLLRAHRHMPDFREDWLT